MAAPASRTLIILDGQASNRGKRFFGDEDGYDSLNKDPDTTEDWSVDWSRELQTAETISAQTVTSDGTVTISSVTQASGVVTFTLSGDPGTLSEVVVQITTSASRVYQRTIRVYEVDA